MYEQCTQLPVLQAVVASTYAPEAVFEDSMVSARGHEAVYRQFAILGVVIRAAQVGAAGAKSITCLKPMPCRRAPILSRHIWEPLGLAKSTDSY